MIENGVDGFFTVDSDWRYTYASEEGAQLAGQSSDDLIGKLVWDTFPEIDETAFGDALRTAMDTREPIQLEAYYSAHDSWYDVRVYPTENGISIYFRDVTERRARARQVEAIFNNTYTFVGLLDPDGTLLEANNTALEFGGLDRDEVVGKPVWDTYWFQANQNAKATARAAVEHARRGALFQEEIHVQGVDREIVIDFTVRPVTNADGEVTHLIPEGHDITEREKLTQELRQERNFIEKALDTLNDIFYVVGTDGELRRWNGRLLEVTGYTNDEIAEMQATNVFPDDEKDRISAAIAETLATGKTVVEAELLGADGDRIPYEFTGARLTDTEDNLIGLVGIGRDITEKRRRERELQTQREHLEALNSLNTVARDVTDAVIEQSTRDEIKQITCEKLTNSDSYTYAWIADADPNSRTDSSRSERDGNCIFTDPEDLLEPGQPLEQSPIGATFRTGEARVVRDVATDPDFEPWHDVAREGASSSFISVPIVHDETQFGVLGIHSERTDAFGHEEREIIEQLGEVIGYVFYAIERKEMLRSALELTFRSETLANPLPTHRTKDAGLTLEAVVPLDSNEGTFIEYWEVNDDSLEAFQRAVERYDPDLDVRLLRTVEGMARLEVTGSNSMSSVFTVQGGTIQSAYLRENAIEIVGEFPETVDPEAITKAVRETIPDLELVSRKRILTPQYLRQMVDENLTDRQLTVLQIAYFGDYFAESRLSTGEELAAHLGITKQTFHHHLRKAESTVFELLFDEPDDPLI
ncbi:PAS domain-containing protein [Natrialbaceae archaeon A-CW3]